MVHVYVSTRLSAGHVLAQTGMGERDVWNVRREGLGKAARWNAVAKHVSMESARRRAHVNAMRASRGMTVGSVMVVALGRIALFIAIVCTLVRVMGFVGQVDCALAMTNGWGLLALNVLSDFSVQNARPFARASTLVIREGGVKLMASANAM